MTMSLDADSTMLAVVKCSLYENGEPRRRVEKATSDTCLFHDLGMYGDIAEAYLELLRDRYGVSMDGFDFDAYFPQEFAGRNRIEALLLQMWPSSRKKLDPAHFQRLSLREIAIAISLGRWSDGIIPRAENLRD
jgi:hypothetical protein